MGILLETCKMLTNILLKISRVSGFRAEGFLLNTGGELPDTPLIFDHLLHSQVNETHMHICVCVCVQLFCHDGFSLSLFPPFSFLTFVFNRVDLSSFRII